MASNQQLRRLRPHLAKARNTLRNLSLFLRPKGGLPDLVIIGAQKAGTTSLFEALSTHPDITPAHMKEVHFLDWQWHFGRGWYERCFPKGAGKRLEATPNYLFFPHAPRRMIETAPDVRLIAVLRDPVARAMSQHRYETRRGNETRSFEKAISDELSIGDEEWAKALDSPAYWPRNLQRHAYLRRGLYAAHLSRWRDHFPRERFFVVEDRALYADPTRHLPDILRFADLDADQEIVLGRTNAGSARTSVPDTALYDYFAEDCAALMRDWGLRPSWADLCGLAE